jgi:hypothetical protein
VAHWFWRLVLKSPVINRLISVEQEGLVQLATAVLRLPAGIWRSKSSGQPAPGGCHRTCSPGLRLLCCLLSPTGGKVTPAHHERHRLEPVALSVRQPWAWAIVSGYKDVENRSWPTNYRGPGRRLDRAGLEHLDLLGHAYPEDLTVGALVGTVEVVDPSRIATVNGQNLAHGTGRFPARRNSRPRLRVWVH